MRVRFIGEGAGCTVFGRTFEAGRATDVSDLDKAFQKKLANNPTFSVVAARGADKAEPPAGG